MFLGSIGRSLESEIVLAIESYRDEITGFDLTVSGSMPGYDASDYPETSSI